MTNKGLAIRQLDIDGRQDALGIDDKTPVFHFCMEAADEVRGISAWQLVVRSERDLMWNSGRNSYTQENYIRYAGKELEPKTLYHAELTIWDENGAQCNFREHAFETGFLGEKWKAEWIEPEQEDACEEKELSFMEMIIPNPEFWGGEARLKECRNLRRRVLLSKPVKKARVYASAHGIYNLYLNGEKVSERRFAPENSAYEKILYYQTYDVTEMLISGENIIGVTLADGWWIGRLGMAGDSCNYGKRLGFLMQMEIFYEDGTKELICSDEKFESAPSYIRYSDLYIGEKQDLTMKNDSWMIPGERSEAAGKGTDNKSPEFTQCVVVSADKECLTAQPMDGVRVTEELPLQEILHTPKKELVLDFGQVIAGVVRLEVQTEEGTEVILEHGEVLDKEGNYINNILGRNKDQKDVFICGNGKWTLEPQFTYHGFRYIRVQGLQEEQILSATALVMGTPLNKTGSFRCSDKLLNRLQSCIEWSTRNNMFSVPTDCPQREKLGWTGDIQVYAKTGCFNYDCRSFLEAWLKNVRAEQNGAGEIPVVVPNPKFQEKTQRIMSGGSNSSAAWGDACVLVPWYLYECYGEKKVLEDNFEMMERWLSYIKENCELKPEGYSRFTPEQKERNPYLWTKQYHFGDWLIPSLRALPNGVQKGTEETADVVGSSFYAITASCFANVCKVLGKKKEAEKYQELTEKIRKAVREEFVSSDGTVKGSSLQGLYVIVLYAGIVEGELKKKVLEKLVSLIHENGDCLDTGFASVSYLLDMLSDNGHKDLAYRLLFQTKAPSWLYMVKNGATSIWENWLAVLENGTPTESSYDHYAFGCVGDWIYRHIGGIRKEAPGYRKILFAPDLDCGLTESECSLITPFGKAALHWKITDGNCKISGLVPVGTEARLIVGEEEIILYSGGFSVERALA